MKRIIYPVLISMLALSIFMPNNLWAQDDVEPEVTEEGMEEEVDDYKFNWDKVLRDWSFGVHAGVTMPYTDVRSYDWFRKTKPVNEYQYTFGGSLTKMFNGSFGVQARYNYGKLQGFSNLNSDFQEDLQFWEIVGIEKPFYFSTNYHQPSINIYMNFSNMFMNLNRRIRAKTKDKDVKDRIFSLYGRLGIGAIWFDSELRDVTTNELVGKQFGYGFSGSAVELAFPFAMGMKFKVSKFIDIHFEGEFTFVHDDKLDAFVIEDVQKDQYILDILDADGIPPERVRNSLGGRYDKHMNFNAGVSFKFGTLSAQKEHLEWVNPINSYIDGTDEKIQYLLDNMYEVKDTDKDGIIDELDEEPNSAPDALVDAKGKTLDSDNDGIPDSEDPEPYSTAALPIEDGKNVYPETMSPAEIKDYVTTYVTTEIKQQPAPKSAGWALSMIFFDLDKTNIKTDMVPELYKVATVMQKYPDLMVNVKGYADIRNTDKYNMNLSENRVKEAIDYLVENYGISRARFKEGFFGEKENLIKNAKKEKEHAINRRVEFTPANY